jgi:hypothetical protein
VTVGWDGDRREIGMWDTRSIAAPFQRITVDKSASYMIPFFEEGTGVDLDETLWEMLIDDFYDFYEIFC